MEWTPDLDEGLLKAPVRLQNVIDTLELKDSRGSGAGPRVLERALGERFRERHQQYETAITCMLPYLRSERAKTEEWMLDTLGDWEYRMRDFHLVLVALDHIQNEMYSFIVERLDEELKCEKALRFVRDMSDERRRSFFAAIRDDVDREFDAAHELLIDTPLPQGATEMVDFLENSSNAAAESAGYDPAPHEVTLDEPTSRLIRIRLEGLLAHTA